MLISVYFPPLQSMAGIYIHIPFCRKACNYCNFHFSTSLSQKQEVVTAIIRELEIRKDFLEGAPIETLYLGGGTPSLLSYDDLSRIFEAAQRQFNLDTLRECTLEANPDDLTPSFLRDLRRTPVNRFSIGVQSFRDDDLKYMNRAHNASQAEYSIKASQDAGFELITIDLIYGTPGLDDAAWKQNLAMVSELSIPHFSAYALTVEEKTALHHSIAKGKQAPVDPEQSAAQLELLMDLAPAMGFEQYEISNFAKNGQYAVHNTNYWRGVPYLGIGPSAHSFDGKRRRVANIANNALYTKAMLHKKPLTEEETLTEEQQLNEYLMTSLRTIWGMDLKHIEDSWGISAVKAIKKNSQIFLEKKWLSETVEYKLRLTNAGRLFADHIASELFV
ncbi:radical SAM family heme chaperone HemW [Rurimicrobium arvi]|uniref:Heme chaperone HemW n=1 Tax=Rurimicrobium arvi TaxID=2049916 RepID=A0ABP8MF54_9BACT